ncbi:MAG: hypothetical protein HYX82_01380, partial [Chloroflexi bacterium]|nr:hypothetical protein [Chloroflexota bacterium]
YYRANQGIAPIKEEVESETSRLNVLRKTSNVEALRGALAEVEFQVSQLEKGYVAQVGNLEVYDLSVDSSRRAAVELQAVQDLPLRDEDRKLSLYGVARYGVSAKGDLAALRSFVGGLEAAPFPIFALDDVDIAPGTGGWILNLNLVVLTRAE